MSTRAMIWATKQQPDRPLDKLILIMMASDSRDHETCFSSVGRLAKISGVNRKTVLQCLSRLRQADYITRDVGSKANPGRAGQTYVFNLERISPSNRNEASENDSACQVENSPESGTVPDDLDIAGTVPFFPRNGPTFSQERSQKGDTKLYETVSETEVVESANQKNEFRNVAARPMVASETKRAQALPPRAAYLLEDCFGYDSETTDHSVDDFEKWESDDEEVNIW